MTYCACFRNKGPPNGISVTDTGPTSHGPGPPKNTHPHNQTPFNPDHHEPPDHHGFPNHHGLPNPQGNSGPPQGTTKQERGSPHDFTVTTSVVGTTAGPNSRSATTPETTAAVSSEPRGPGERGHTGATGPTGPLGPSGHPQATGPRGPAGPAVPSGPSPPSASGQTGATSAGRVSWTAVEGPSGKVGVTGPMGRAGPLTHSTGPPGQPGESGRWQARGQRGERGPPRESQSRQGSATGPGEAQIPGLHRDLTGTRGTDGEATGAGELTGGQTGSGPKGKGGRAESSFEASENDKEE